MILKNIEYEQRAYNNFSCYKYLASCEYNNNKKNDLYQYSTELTFREIK